MSIATPYTQRNPNLPWGYWLVETDGREVRERYRDEEGNLWNSVREYLWVARLGMGRLIHAEVMHQALEFLLAYLVTVDRRIVHTEEEVGDLFAGDWDATRFYRCWANGIGLISTPVDTASRDELTLEARSILVMLASTRRPDTVPLAIGLPTLQSRHGVVIEDDARRQKVIGELEAFAEKLDFRFERFELNGFAALRLVGDALGSSMPMRRTLWSMTFDDTYARDRFYLWLQHRIDRWSAWGGLADLRGAKSLSEHLLKLQFADQTADLAD